MRDRSGVTAVVSIAAECVGGGNVAHVLTHTLFIGAGGLVVIRIRLTEYQQVLFHQIFSIYKL